MMRAEHVEEHLLGLVLGVLPAGTRNTTELHLALCARCTGALARARDDAATLSMALPPLPPSPLMREQLLHAAGEVGRFTDLIAPLARALALSRGATEQLVGHLDGADGWEVSEHDGSAWYPVPARDGAGFLRVPGGYPVDSQAHGACGTATVIQGRARSSHGETFGVGAQIEVAAHAAHDYLALPGPDLICLFHDPEARAPQAGRMGRGARGGRRVPLPLPSATPSK